MKKILVLTAMVAVCISTLTTACEAALVLSWNTVGNTGSETTEASVSNHANIAAANLTLGAGITPSGNENRFGGTSWSIALADSIANGDYIQFIVAPTSGFKFTATSLDFVWDRSPTGPSSVELRSSVDGFGSGLGQVTGMASGGTTTVRTINISGLSDITTATTFRLYGFGGTNSSFGTGGFDTENGSTSPNVVFNGTVSAVPEPSALLLVGSIIGAGLLRRRRA